MLLQLIDVSSGYKGVPVLSDISLHVNEGEFISIVGSNGAGKSTLLRTISGSIKVTSGEIRFRGEKIDHLDAADIVNQNRIAHVPEGRLLFPYMTVMQNLLLGAYTIKDKVKKDKQLAYVLELFPRLAERKDQLAGTLSGGEQQMCAIGRGLMLSPKLLMLDEPSLGVQPNIVSKMYDTIKMINSDGTTILLVEQNITNSLEMADRAYVIQTGKIIAEGKGSELLGSDLVQKAYLGL
ncbi:ABC transporter ATP-binding protein [Aminobacterium colombiense]|jgi:branched-chain amino acid transport system ATP-binding protein